MDGLEEELLEVDDGDRGGEPVEGERDGGEARGEREREGDRCKFLCGWR